MGVYRIKIPDGRTVRIEAPDEATALQGAKEFAESSSQQTPQPGTPSSPSPEFDQMMQEASQRHQQRWNTQRATVPNTLEGSAATTLAGIVNGIPIIGPMAQNTTDALIGAGGMLFGKDYNETVQGLRDRRAELAAAAPMANLAGNLAGSLGGWGVAAKAAPAAMGMVGGLLPRVGNSAVSGAAITAADTAMRGGDLGEIAGDAGVAGAIGGLIPVVGAGIRGGLGAVGRYLEPTVGAIRDSGKEALRRTGKAFARDMKANPQMVMGQADEAAARAAGVPIINADRGGETVRALTRSVANQSPEARAVIERTASDRFAGQADRAVEVMRRVAGGNVDDLAFQQRIKDTARLMNKPAYDKAFAASSGRAVWTPRIRQLMQSDRFRKAVELAESRSRDKAATTGGEVVRDPFVYSDGRPVNLRYKPDQRYTATNPHLGHSATGQADSVKRALPNLEFWDQVKRNLDGMIEAAQRGARPDRALASDLTQMKQMLVSELDAAVPDYRRARGTAALFFGADDALEAGKKFATQPRQLPEATKAFTAMTTPDQTAFRVGFASEVIDRIKDARFRANVIDQIFGSPAKREMMTLVFGKAKARELEAYIRVEEIADKLRNALGNSTTARQLMELGIGAGSGAILTGGDWKGALGGAALMKGGRYLARRVDDKVMQEVARLLTSDDPAMLKRAVNQAMMSPMWMDALEAWGRLLAAPARALTIPQAAAAA